MVCTANNMATAAHRTVIEASRMASAAHADSVTAAPRTPLRRMTAWVSGYPQALSPSRAVPVVRLISLALPAGHRSPPRSHPDASEGRAQGHEQQGRKSQTTSRCESTRNAVTHIHDHQALPGPTPRRSAVRVQLLASRSVNRGGRSGGGYCAGRGHTPGHSTTDTLGAKVLLAKAARSLTVGSARAVPMVSVRCWTGRRPASRLHQGLTPPMADRRRRWLAERPAAAFAAVHDHVLVG